MSTMIDAGRRSAELLSGQSKRVTLPCPFSELESIAQEWGTSVEQLVVTSCARVAGNDVVIVRAGRAQDPRALGLDAAREFTEGTGEDCALCGFELAQHDLGVTCPTV